MIPDVCPHCGGFVQYFQLNIECRDCGRVLMIWSQEKGKYVNVVKVDTSKGPVYIEDVNRNVSPKT